MFKLSAMTSFYQERAINSWIMYTVRMEYYAFRIKNGSDSDRAWEALEALGVAVFSSVENDDGTAEIHGTYDGDLNEVKKKAPFVEEVIKHRYDGIDWEQQWQEHGADYREGFVHIDLGKEGLRLKPGPGFGVMSHPTTQLALEMMKQVGVKGANVVDVGSGSGILSLAASALGAKHVWGVDIDESALRHAEENAAINTISNCEFVLPKDLVIPEEDVPLIVVMNMISSEQALAWESLPMLRDRDFVLITSGVREEEKGTYLEFLQSLGVRVVDEASQEGWLCFICHF
jgi:ribosomal protein L11 methyltransferase